MIFQRPVKGGRASLYSCVLPEIRAKARAIARQYGVSTSFVLATTFAQAFGIKKQEDYLTAYTRRKRKTKKRRAA